MAISLLHRLAGYRSPAFLALMLLATFMREATAAEPERAAGDDPPGLAASRPFNGLQFRLSASRTVFQAWELPTFEMQIRNAGQAQLTLEKLHKTFDPDGEPVGPNPPRLRFYFRPEHHGSPYPNLSLVPRVRWDMEKFAGLKPGETRAVPVTIAGLRELGCHDNPYPLTAGNCTLLLGVYRPRNEDNFTTDGLTLTVLPAGIRDEKELAQYLKPYQAGDSSIRAGFVPNKTMLVEGEPIFATFMVENLADEPFSFETGGPGRGPRNDRSLIEVIGSDGKPVDDPSPSGNGGGKSNCRTAEGRDTVVETVEIPKYRTISRPGKYRVACRFDLTPPTQDRETKDLNIPVATTYDLTILERTGPRVGELLQELFAQADKTGALPLATLIDTISSVGRESAVPGLARLAATGDVEHRAAAAVGLGKIPSPEALKALLSLIHDAALDVRRAALAALSAFPEPAAIDALVQALSDRGDVIRISAALALGHMKSDAAVDALLANWPSPGYGVSGAILLAMGTSHSPRVFDTVARATASEDKGIRYAALDAIASFPPEQAADAVRPLASGSNLEIREDAIRTLAERLHQPIDAEWLIPVIKSRKGANTLGDAPRLMQLYGGEQAAPALLSCLDFQDPSVRGRHNATLIDQQLACRGPLAIPWIADPNREGTAEETAQNRRTLDRLKAWVDYCRAHPAKEASLPASVNPEDEEKPWGKPVDGLSLRAQPRRNVWPAEMPQVVLLTARNVPGGGWIPFSARPAVLEIEVNSEWYTLPPEADLSVSGNWSNHFGRGFQDLELDSHWRRKSDDQRLDLPPGKYTIRVASSWPAADKPTAAAISAPATFEVIPTE